MRLWVVLGFGLMAAACSPTAVENDCKDRSQCLNFAADEEAGSGAAGDGLEAASGFAGSGGTSAGSYSGSGETSEGALSGSNNASNGAVKQQLIDDVVQGKLSAEALAAALNYGHVQGHHVAQGYSSDAILALLRQQLRPAYASSVNECRVVGVGSRPCGGPERFMVYSAANTNELVLLELVGAYTRKRAADDAREGLVSDCSVLPEPALVLLDGICRAARTAVM